MLRTKLFKGFAVLVLILGGLSAALGIGMIKTRLLREAQTRVDLDMGSAWAVCETEARQIETILRLAASKKLIVDACSEKQWENEEVQRRLEVIQHNFGLDFLSLADTDGRVVLRAAAPHGKGDFKSADAAVSAALRGETVHGMQLFSKSELEREADGLSERAFIALERTARARPASKIAETRGLVLMAAVPVTEGAAVHGAIYGGVLLNRNHRLVDRVKEIVFRNEEYRGRQVGTVTIFLGDCRISTTVRLSNGNRALGTRASKEVSDSVLDNGRPWKKRAFVVNDWYLTAYDPIRDLRGDVIGMLYVGILERPFTDQARSLMMNYAALLVFGLTVALVLAFVFASRQAAPIHSLVEAANRMRRGEPPAPVPVHSSCQETESLIQAFNEMTAALAEREARLKEANEKLEAVNASLQATNHSYMETLGFVSHELKTPLATMMNYVYLLKSLKSGPLTEKQAKAVAAMDATVKRLVEMVRHYLNLSRIESGEFQPIPSKVAVLEDVVAPMVETFMPEIAGRDMRLENRIAPGTVLKADINMTREVFENLLSNAIKYGRAGGVISLSARPTEDGFVEFAVRNEGEGIPPDKREAIFEKFTRLESQQSVRQQKGTGLGLFITKNIVAAHGGRIGVESVPNDWTEFRFTLPRCKEESK